MGRRPCCAKGGLNRGAWSAGEDRILTNYIQLHGEGHWRDLPQRAGLKRCGKSCRLRWLNYLRPDIKRGNISTEEEELIIRLHKLLGNRWSIIAGRLPGRTDNEIKNYWNSNLSKRVAGNKNPQYSKKQLVDRSKEAKCKEKVKPPGNIGDHFHQVIRTKAVRCTKVVINIPQTSAPLNKHVAPGEGCRDSTQDSPSDHCSSGVGDDDLLMDFNVSDLLAESPSSNANYEMINNNNDQEGDHDMLLLPSPDLAPTNGIGVFVDDIVRPPSSCDTFEQMGAFDLEGFAKFLGSEEEWI